LTRFNPRHIRFNFCGIFFEEKKELPVIAAGSFLEFTLSDHFFSMPVGRIEYRHLGPMTSNAEVDCIISEGPLIILNDYPVSSFQKP